MLENFNDYISIGILILIVFSFIYIGLKNLFSNIEKSRIRRELESNLKRKKE